MLLWGFWLVWLRRWRTRRKVGLEDLNGWILFQCLFAGRKEVRVLGVLGKKMPLCVKIYLFSWDWVPHQTALGWTHTGAASIILWWHMLTAWAGGARKVTEIHISVSMHAEDTCWLCEVPRDMDSFCLIYLWVSVAPPLYIGAASGQSENLIFRFSWSQKLLSHHQIQTRPPLVKYHLSINYILMMLPAMQET